MRGFIFYFFGSFFLSNLVGWLAMDSLLLRLGAPIGWRLAMSIFFVAQIFGLILLIGARMTGAQPGTGMGRPILSLLMIWNLTLALPTAVVSAIAAVICWLMNFHAEPGSMGQQAGSIAVAIPFALALLATVVAVWQLNRFRVRQVTLNIPGLPAALKGFTISHLSDSHIGKLTRGRVLDDLVAASNSLNPDLVVFTGDLVNMSLEDLPRGLEFLRSLKAKHGLFVCEGNHDLIQSRSGFETMAKSSGVRFLFNESVVIDVNGQAVQMLGLRWGEEHRRRGTDLPSHVPEGVEEGLLRKRQPDEFTILLAHHPDAFDMAAEAGVQVTLSGHTHGGQLMLMPTFGFGPWIYRYWSGVYEKGASRLVVSNGAGNWFPLRIGAPAEIIHITLQQQT